MVFDVFFVICDCARCMGFCIGSMYWWQGAGYILRLTHGMYVLVEVILFSLFLC